jgi:branched-chain amino acid transport system ATP-binding protein
MLTRPAEPTELRDENNISLAVREAAVGYGAAPIVHDVSLTVSRGTIVCVIGPNGAGKSTLLKALTGRLRPFSGRVQFGGADVTGATGNELARFGLGYVPRSGDVFAPLTLQDNLEMGAYLLPRRAVAGRIDQVLDGLPILKPMLKRYAKTFSGGERKLLAIGRCPVLEPKVLILDVPTANPSPAMAQMILHEYVVSLARAGTAVLLVEQRARDAMEICNWCNVMVVGRIAVSSEPAPLLAEPDFGELFLVARAPDRRAADLQATDGDAASREPVDGSAASHDAVGPRHEETGGGE